MSTRSVVFFVILAELVGMLVGFEMGCEIGRKEISPYSNISLSSIEVDKLMGKEICR
jgi:hypothetical protein